MGCFTSFGRVLLIILNLLFLLVSLAIFAAGVFLRFFPGTILSSLLTFAKDFQLVSLPSGADDIDYVPLLNTLGVTLIVVGCSLLSVSFFACCGACYKWRPFLILFCIVMLVLILALAALGGLFLTKDSVLNTSLKDSLADEIRTKYKGPADTTDVFSMVVNMLSYSLKCCGFRNYEDFNNTNWKPFTYVQNGNHNITFNASVTITCCERKYLNATPLVLDCAKAPINVSMIYNEGCYDKLYETIEGSKTWVAIGLVLLVLLEVFEVTAAILMVKEINASQVSPI